MTAAVRQLPGAPEGMSAEVEEVTPLKAREWLGRNTMNRPKKPRKIDQYARDMAAGRWQLTGEGIKFARGDGRLLDGQNRLYAVIQSEDTVRMLIIRGVEAPAQDVMDSGAARSAADALSMRGVTNAQKITGAARIAMCVEAGVAISSSRFTNSEVQGWVLDNMEITDVATILGRRARLLPLSPSVSLYCAWRLADVDAEAAADFFEQLAEGVGLTAGSPILALKRRLAGSYGGPRKTTAEEQIICTFRAWNFWRQGKSLERVTSVLKGEDAKIPDPI